LFQGQDLGFLCGVELLEPGLECCGLLVAVGGRVGVSGGQLGGQELGAARTEDVLGEERGDDLV